MTYLVGSCFWDRPLAAAGKQTDRPRARAAETVYEGCVILPITGSVGYGETAYSDSWLE